MLTGRGKALLATAAGLWLFSRLLGVPELAMGAVAALALLVLSVVATRLTSTRLTARRSVHPPRLFFDAEGEVEIRLANAGRVSTASLQVEDTVPATLADGPRFVVPPLAAGRVVTLRYPLHARHRGQFPIGPLTIRVRDPFGLATRQHRFGVTDHVIVYPPVWRLPAGVPLGGHQAAGGEGRPRPAASGEELANVREYVRGDDLRKVHWRSTAHRGKLMVRQDETPQNPHAVVVLDTRAEAHRGGGPASSFEYAVSAAASATYHLAERAYGTTLLTGPVTGPPRPMPWELHLEQLAVVSTDRRTDMPALWRQLSRGVAGEGVLVAIVTVPGPGELREMVRGGRGFATRVAVLVDASTFGGRHGRPLPDVDRTTDALRTAGWRVTVVQSGQRLDERWRELVMQRRGAPIATAGAARTAGGAR